MLSLLFSGLLWAGAGEDLSQASNPALGHETRMEAFQRLVELGATDVSVIRDACQNGDAELRERWVAIRALGKIGGSPARQVLPALASDPKPAIRSAAISAIGDLGSKDFTMTVATGLSDDSIMVRAAAADALGRLGDPAAIQALGDALKAPDGHYRGSSLWVRKHYVDALGAIGSTKAYSVLLLGLDDTDPAVVASTLRALESIAGFTFSDGREPASEKEAWRRWLQARLGR
jgi:HEAT repeat protein